MQKSAKIINIILALVALGLLALCIVFLIGASFHSFLYFNF